MSALGLDRLVNDLADALVVADRSGASHKTFQPGIGPFGEAQAVRLALDVLKITHPDAYGDAEIRRTPDVLIPGQWAIEAKIVRPFGDNGKPAEHWSQNVLHPYEGNTSSLGDCLKLLRLPLNERRAVVVLGFEHVPAQVLLEPAIRSFELVARQVMHVDLSSRYETVRDDLVHAVHQRLRVFGFEVLGRLESCNADSLSA